MEKLNNLAEKVEEEINISITDGIIPEFDFGKYKNDFISSMDDDLNSPQACAVIFDFIREVNRTISENEKINSKFYSDVKSFLQQTAEGVLGILDFSKVSIQSNGDLQNELIELFIKLRTNAKKEKNFALADKIRDELKEIGITLQDSKDKTSYKISNR